MPPRSCKRREILFPKSLLLFSTWREYFYSQPTHFSSQQKCKDLNKGSLLLQDLDCIGNIPFEQSTTIIKKIITCSMHYVHNVNVNVIVIAIRIFTLFFSEQLFIIMNKLIDFWNVYGDFEMHDVFNTSMVLSTSIPKTMYTWIALYNLTF